VGQTGIVLEVEDAGAISGWPVLDLPASVHVEYGATLPDGRSLVVTCPDHDWDYSDFRVFLGTSTGMIERPVSSVQRARDGGTTTIVFKADGTTATALFPSSLTADALPTLTTAGTTVVLTLMENSLPSSFAYLCL
jgi:hypothetical protein